MLLADEVIHFRGYGSSVAHTRCRVFQFNDAIIFVVTEMPDNPGLSVTNAWGGTVDLAYHLVRSMIQHVRADLDPETIIWIEHYPEHNNHSEDFDRVLMSWDGHRYRLREDVHAWKRLTLGQFEDLIGETWVGEELE